MEVSTSPAPKPNEFVIPQTDAYARTDIEIWEVAEFLMTKLEPVDIENLGLDERECTICQQEFHVSEDVKLSHPPVKISCGHIFGKNCLIQWLDPLCCGGLFENEHGGGDTDSDRYGDAKTNCPMCRQVLIPKCRVEPMEFLAQRLSFFDTAYARAGVARSDKEERSRERLWEYVAYCRSINEPPQIDGALEYDMAQIQFLDFSLGLDITQQLTPEQKDVRKKMLEIGHKDVEYRPRDDESFYLVLTRVDDELRVTKTRRFTFVPRD